MAFSYNPAAIISRDRVRLLIPDRVTPDHIFEDEEITAFLAMESDVWSATAAALETIASDQAMVLKVMKLLDISTDGAKVSDALLSRAQMLRERSVSEAPSFDWAEMVVDSFSARERLWAEALRS